MNDKKRIWIIIGIIGLLIITIIYYITVQKVSNDYVHIVKLNNDDTIIFNIGGEPFLPYDNLDHSVPKLRILSDQEFAQVFSNQIEEKFSLSLPAKVKNLQHCYQVVITEGGKTSRDYDEIYQWETSKYGSAKKGNLLLIRNSGNREASQDRGYVELSLYRNQPKRFKKVLYYPSTAGMREAESYLNKKALFVYENTDNASKERGAYTARILDIDGKGTEAYLMADNVDRDYFISILEGLIY